MKYILSKSQFIEEGIVDTVKHLYKKGKEIFNDIFSDDDTKNDSDDFVNMVNKINPELLKLDKKVSNFSTNKEQILFTVRIPEGSNITNYVFYNGLETNVMDDNYKNIFAGLKPNFKFTMPKNESDVKIKRFVNLDGSIEFSITLYSILDELEYGVTKDMYNKPERYIENETPMITIYLKNLKKGFEKRVKQTFDVINKRTVVLFNANFADNNIDVVLNAIKSNLRTS